MSLSVFILALEQFLEPVFRLKTDLCISNYLVTVLLLLFFGMGVGGTAGIGSCFFFSFFFLADS